MFRTMFTRLQTATNTGLATRRLPPPDVGAVDPLVAYLLRRGWRIVDRDSHTTAILDYPASFHSGLNGDDRRVPALDNDLQELEVTLARCHGYWFACFTSCGTVIGCDRHRSVPLHIGVHAPIFTTVLRDLEVQARLVSPHEVSHCLLFGTCGHENTPNQPCQLAPLVPDEPASLHVVPCHSEEAE
ncbi:hypothetical protein CFP71_28260 [Amycolatopsis thailandensis]|uniref:Uncharacterized protein n=1 Tax=Amycolatopsis thailandensis TaxID=589330 RepID=A0A229RUK8_9PSEU|nr:hypothetical protein [Amycolatopsis thailandensis]OXM50326.1 hypothetical protein CFP71_28260 [Amycolatopsis thailandensis]